MAAPVWFVCGLTLEVPPPVGDVVCFGGSASFAGGMVIDLVFYSSFLNTKPMGVPSGFNCF